MAPPPRGIRLPKAIREELGLSEKATLGGGGGGGRGKPRYNSHNDRKAQRKQQRQEKKQKQHGNRRNGYGAQNGGEFDDDEDFSEDDEPTPPPPKKTKEQPKSILKKEKRKADSEGHESEAAPSSKRAKKDKKEKSEKPEKTDKKDKKDKKKRKDDSEDEESKPGKPRINKAVKEALEQDDMEVEYLEKKLGLKGKKMPKSFGDEGLDFLLEGLKDNYLDSDEDRKKKKKKYVLDISSEDEDDDMLDKELLGGASDEEEEVELNEASEPEEDEEGSEDDGEEDEEFGGFSDEEGDEDLEDDEDEDEDEKDEDEGGTEGEDSQDEGDDSKSTLQVTRTRENPYKAPVPDEKPAEEFKPSAQKYIPPSLRKAATTESEQLQRLRRQIQGTLNRLSEAKLVPLLTEVENLYANNPRGDVTNILTDLIITSICDRSSMLDTFMILHAGFVAAIYKIIGTDFGAHVVQSVVEKFMEHHKTTNAIADPTQQGKECTNLMSFLAELYNFGVVAPVLIFDFIRLFLTELTELHTELMLKIVRMSGSQLRTDDPSAIKSLAQLLQPAIAKAGGEANLSVRTKFMIETLTNLKNNRLKNQGNASGVVTSESTIRMKKLLGSLNARRLRATEPLRASLDDITNVKTKGKWWLVGASWAGGPTPNNTTSLPTSSTPVVTADAEALSDDDSDADVNATPDLVTLAKQHRMNTSIRRAIFITLLSATDFTDAYTRLQKLHLKRMQSREIPRVLIHCAISETAYNPYYTLLAKRLIAGSHPLKMTFTFVLWEYFRRFGEEDDRHAAPSDEEDEGDDGDSEWERLNKKSLTKIANLARLYGQLMNERVLGPGILKTLRWGPYMKPATKSFLEVFWGSALMDHGSEDWIVSQMAEMIELCRGVSWFLRKREVVVVGDAERIKEVSKRKKRLVKELEGVVGRVQGGAIDE